MCVITCYIFSHSSVVMPARNYLQYTRLVTFSILTNLKILLNHISFLTLSITVLVSKILTVCLRRLTFRTHQFEFSFEFCSFRRKVKNTQHTFPQSELPGCHSRFNFYFFFLCISITFLAFDLQF